jgi:cyclopropane fatty-acyl-phospholipid synthase-like methyltransferase
LNVLVDVLRREEGSAEAMHYGLFDGPEDSIGEAQERSTALMLSRLPPAPAALLEVGVGLGATLARLVALGYDAEGITPDPTQAAAARERFGTRVRIIEAGLESFAPGRRYDAVLFQESSQYIDTETLFRRLRELCAPSARVVVLDEFALRPVATAGALHRLDRFLESAEAGGFRLEEEVDLSSRAAPTVDYFLERIPRHRAAIDRDLSISAERIDALLASGAIYRELYRSGTYGYRLLRFSA